MRTFTEHVFCKVAIEAQYLKHAHVGLPEQPRIKSRSILETEIRQMSFAAAVNVIHIEEYVVLLMAANTFEIGATDFSKGFEFLFTSAPFVLFLYILCVAAVSFSAIKLPLLHVFPIIFIITFSVTNLAEISMPFWFKIVSSEFIQLLHGPALVASSAHVQAESQGV